MRVGSRAATQTPCHRTATTHRRALGALHLQAHTAAGHVAGQRKRRGGGVDRCEVAKGPGRGGAQVAIAAGAGARRRDLQRAARGRRAGGGLVSEPAAPLDLQCCCNAASWRKLVSIW